MKTEVRIIPITNDESIIAEIEANLKTHNVGYQRSDFGLMHRSITISEAADIDALFEALDSLCREENVKEIMVITPGGYIMSFKP